MERGEPKFSRIIRLTHHSTGQVFDTIPRVSEEGFVNLMLTEKPSSCIFVASTESLLTGEDEQNKYEIIIMDPQFHNNP